MRVTLRVKNMLLKLSIAFVFVSSFVLGIHNASLYAPRHGFDGEGHVFYIQYIAKHGSIPSPNLGVETHQPPLFYAISAVVLSLTDSLKAVQYVNVVVFWLIIGMVGIGLRNVLKNSTQVLIGMYALIALPMLNIFPPMVTNELLNTFWIISAIVALLFILSASSKRKRTLSIVWFIASLILGFWTKVSIITVFPTALLVFLILFTRKNHSKTKVLLLSILAGFIIFIGCLPILLRGSGPQGGEHATNLTYVLKSPVAQRPLNFYYRLDWLTKLDIHNAHYYSLLGGAWNSFWTDGQNAITPFVLFHKKAFMLWIFGFMLFPLSIYGLTVLSKKNGQAGLIVNAYGLTALAFFIYFNTLGTHYSAIRLTYIMGIVICYAFGIAVASRNKTLRTLLLMLISIQFFTMLSFFWIESWWHVTR